mmetsp:Transcript_21156/g.46473  ORF Transcript_21156/g.46473 Transcript_21156/m.46473 type:complete len:114 (+) Transcript_21156:53-394(+)
MRVAALLSGLVASDDLSELMAENAALHQAVDAAKSKLAQQQLVQDLPKDYDPYGNECCLCTGPAPPGQPAPTSCTRARCCGGYCAGYCGGSSKDKNGECLGCPNAVLGNATVI